MLKINQDVFEKVFMNLIENVLCHASDEKTIEIKAQFLPDEESTEISVNNNGPEYIKVFESLRKSIGLSLIQASLEAHKFVFRIENRIGVCVFSISKYQFNWCFSFQKKRNS